MSKKKFATGARDPREYVAPQAKTWYVGLRSRPYRHVTREAQSDDRWDRDSTSTDWSINGINVRSEDSYGLLPIEAPAGAPVYIVYAIWSTGDSFGHDENANCEALSVYTTREAAEEERKRLTNAKDNSDRKDGEWLPWFGYFESLTRVDIESGIV